MFGITNAISNEASDDINQKRFKLACQGDHDAYWALIEPHSGLIYSVAFGILKDHEQSQDIMHEVFIRAFKSINNLRNAKRITPWLYTMTKNVCYDLIRKNVRADLKKSDVIYAQPKVVPIHEVLIKEEELKLLQTALNSLPEPFRIIIGMKYMNQYSCKEIAGALDISVEAVKSRLFEARKLLAKRMDEVQSHPQSVNGGIQR